MRAIALRHRVLAAVLLSVVAAGGVVSGASPWTRAGLLFPGGYVTALVLDPTAEKTVYAATEAGVFKTTDGGELWVPSSNGLPLSSVLSLVVDPSSPSTLYALSLYHGVYRSSNGGSTWRAVGDGSVPPDAFGTLAVGSDGVVYAAFWGLGVLKSLDGCETWTLQNDGLDSVFIAPIAAASGAPAILYAASDTGIFRTNDRGARWNAVSSLKVTALAIDPHRPDTVYGLSSEGVFKSIDGGTTWEARNSGLPADAWPYALAFDPGSSAKLYLLARSSLYASTDAGETWVDRTAGVEASDFCPSALAVAPGASSTVYLGNQCSGGVFRSVDEAVSWRRTADRFAAPRISALLPDASSAAVFAATDRGVFRSSDAGATWLALNAGLDDIDMVSIVQAPSDPSTLYAGTRSGGFYRSADGGRAWARSTYVSEWYANPLVVDPVISSTIYTASLDELVRSTDGGRTFNLVRRFDSGISALSFSGATLLVGTGGGEMWASPDRGIAWELVHAFGWSQGITAIVTDPRSPSTMYAGWFASGLLPPLSDPRGGVFKSLDGGSTWESVEDGLGVTSLIMHPGNSSVLFAGKVRGQVVETTDGGTSWRSAGEGMPDGWITALMISPASPSTLYAGMSSIDQSGLFAVRDDSRILHLAPDPTRATRRIVRGD